MNTRTREARGSRTNTRGEQKPRRARSGAKTIPAQPRFVRSRLFYRRISKTKQGGSKRSALGRPRSTFSMFGALVPYDAAVPIDAVIRIAIVRVVVVAILVIRVVQSNIRGIHRPVAISLGCDIRHAGILNALANRCQLLAVSHGAIEVLANRLRPGARGDQLRSRIGHLAVVLQR